jgi:hypothetical protein
MYFGRATTVTSRDMPMAVRVVSVKCMSSRMVKDLG